MVSKVFQNTGFFFKASALFRVNLPVLVRNWVFLACFGSANLGLLLEFEFGLSLFDPGMDEVGEVLPDGWSDSVVRLGHLDGIVEELDS